MQTKYAIVAIDKKQSEPACFAQFLTNQKTLSTPSKESKQLLDCLWLLNLNSDTALFADLLAVSRNAGVFFHIVYTDDPLVVSVAPGIED